MSSTILRRALPPRATLKALTLHSPLSSSATNPTSPPPLPDVSTTISTAVSALTNHRSNHRWSTLLSLFPNGFSPHQISQILLQIRHNPRLAQTFFNFATQPHSLSSPLTLHCYATIIHILARANLRSRAQTLLKEAIFNDHHYQPKIFQCLVETYMVCDSSPIVFDLLIRSLLQVGKFDPCVEIVRLLGSRGFYPHVKTCNALIYAALEYKGCFCGYDLYRELFVSKVLPNVHAFNQLMVGFSRNGSIDMVERVWVEMCTLNCTPKVCSYSILIAAYCEGGEIEKAKSVWDEVKLKGLKVDVVGYNALIGGYCRIGEIEKGEEVYREMGLSGLKGSAVTYHHLINGYCLVGDADKVIHLYNDMCRKGFVPDSSSVDSMVRVICDKKSALEAFELIESVMRNDDFVVSETSYEFLIKGLCSEGNMEEAMKVRAQMVEKGFRPNSHVYGACIDGHIKRGKFDEAESLRKEMIAT